jgi:hypothetical protein
LFYWTKSQISQLHARFARRRLIARLRFPQALRASQKTMIFRAIPDRLNCRKDFRSDRVQQRDREREIREELVKLTLEHRELDTEIATLEAAGGADQLTVTRLKRRKLKLKDQITALEDQHLPDIIA